MRWSAEIMDEGSDIPGLNLLPTVERDLTIIRRDILAVLQETADVRATMDNISSHRRSVSKRFVVVTGLVCFILLAVLVICQEQLRSWLPLL